MVILNLNKYRGLLALLVVMLTTFVSCVKDIDLEEKREQKIVVNCVLTPDSIQTLSLTYSNPLNLFYYDEVETATATLYCDSIKVGGFEKTGYSQWQLKHTPEAGRKYQLKVEVPGWPELNASTSMPHAVRIIKSDGNNTSTRRYFNQYYAETPYWMFIIAQRKDTIMVTPAVMPGDKMTTSLGTNHLYSDNFNTSDNMMFYDTGGKDGTTREHIAYIRITQPEEKTEDEIPFYLEGNLHKSLVFFRAASAEYDAYMKSSVQKMMVYDTFDDPSSWFDEDEIYTNIDNGLGIFAAYSDCIVQCHYILDNIEEH